MNKLVKYDKLLRFKKYINGLKVVQRISPFNSQRIFDILTIQNQYPGSFRWILTDIALMDTRKFDIVGKSIRNNMNIRNQRDDDRMTKDISDFWEVGGESIIL